MAKQKTSQPVGWEMKDRIYRLKGDASPVLYVIPCLLYTSPSPRD